MGYNGPQCAYTCTYPYYGEDCLSKCDCTEEQCDFVFGCIATSTPKCPSGYNGPQCAYPCTYPYYGEDCLSKCYCTEEQCDFVFGRKATSVASNIS
ncbi:uncharacterized protein LOC111107908 [Crassostrea virginica]